MHLCYTDESEEQSEREDQSKLHFAFHSSLFVSSESLDSVSVLPHKVRVSGKFIATADMSKGENITKQ